MERLKDPKVQGAFRHLMTSLGPLLAARGVVEDIYWQMVVGLVMAVVGFWASWTAPEKGDK